MYRCRWLLILLPWSATLVGCNGTSATPPPAKLPEVLVSQPISKSVTEYEEFTGLTQALHTIEVRARVSGYLANVYFKEGEEVKEGDPLFEIDPRPYAAELARAKANVAQSEAHRERLRNDYQRALRLYQTGAMGREDYDKAKGDLAEAVAAVGVAKAQQETAELNLGFTKVRAKISGRISRRLIDPWNMVKADETPLTTIVSLDPIYAYFDVDETTVLRLGHLVREGKIKPLRQANLPILLGLGDEEGFPHPGKIDFIDNQIDANTGTLRMRGVFPNPKRLLTPGLFIRIQFPIGAPHAALLVSEQALGRDQAQKFVYVINEHDQVEYRRVTVGRLYDGLREITDGLKPGERIVVSGLQRIRVNKNRQDALQADVEPKPVPMPASERATTAAPVAKAEGASDKRPSE